MGWKDAPLVEEDAPSTTSRWMDAPVVEDHGSPPSTGQVALNAISKGVANFLNTPNTINQLVVKGVASIPGLENIPAAHKFLNDLANNKEINRNLPLELAKKLGLVKDEREPQTLPQRLLDTGIQAAVGSAAIPSGGLLNTLKQAAVGGASGITAQGTKELTDSPLLGGLVGALTPLALKGGIDAMSSGGKKVIINEPTRMTFKEARQYGFVVEPSKVRQPSSKLESIAGKASIAQGAIEKNQSLANNLAAKAIGLPAETPITPELLKNYKNQVMEPYRMVDQAFKELKGANKLEWFPRVHSNSLVDEYIEAGQNANALWKSYGRDPKIDILKAAKAADSYKEEIFNDIIHVAKASGNPDLPQQILQAKQLYAKINDVETALNVGSGNISMPTLGRLLDKGKPLSNELKVIAKFANAFPRVAREIESTPPSGVSGTDMSAAAILGTLGAATSGNPLGLVVGGLPLLRGPARHKLLSDAYQNNLLKEPRLNLGLNLTPTQAKIASGMAGKVMFDKKEEE